MDNTTKGSAAVLTKDCYDNTKSGCSYATTGSYSCKGQCNAGQSYCAGGKWIGCSGATYPMAEQCDGKDNDCDGTLDDIKDLNKSCVDATRNGICQAGTYACYGNTKICKQTLVAKSSSLITSAKIVSKDGTQVPDGTLFTIASAKGTVMSVDGDPNIAGVQVLSVNGSIDFSIAAPDLAKAEVIATATDTPKYIPDYDNLGTSSAISVSGLVNKIITLSVAINLEHPRSDDLEIVLASPKGTKVYLETACNPSTGSCKLAKDISASYPSPTKAVSGSISQFYGEVGNGTWTLSLKDPYYGPKNSQGVVDPGKLLSWTLKFNAAAVTSGTMSITAAHAKSASCKSSFSVAYNATPITKTVAEDFTSSARNDTTTTTARWDTSLGRIDPFPADFGTGRDGDLTVNSGTYNLNLNAQAGRLFPDAVSFTVTALGANTATLKGGVGGLVIGDEVLLINMQGDTTNNASVGNFEIKKIAKIDFASNKLYFATSLVKIYGTTSNSTLTGQKIVLQRVPHYRNVYVKGTLTADKWDGTKGGVLFFKSSGTVQVLGTVTMSTSGYRYASGKAGESYHGGYKVADTNGAFGAGSMSSSLTDASCSIQYTGSYYWYAYMYNYGGGAGGTIFLRARSMNVGNKRVTAKGGTNAGAGRIRMDFFGLSGITDPAHYSGFTGKTVAVTKNLNFTAKTLVSAQVTKSIEDIRGGSVTYSLSADGGTTWTTAIKGKALTFTTAGTDLRLKVSFTNKSLDPLSLMGVLVSFKTK